MKIPDSDRKKALIIVDVQDVFLTKRNKYVLKNIEHLIKNTEYDLYLEVAFYAPKNSIWDKQTHWRVSEKKAVTNKSIARLISKITKVDSPYKRKHFKVLKSSKSAIEGIVVGGGRVPSLLGEVKIKEIHIIGLDTNDCVLATAYSSFDWGYFTYVIEECVESSGGEKVHKAGLELLRHVNLTNHSSFEKKFKEI